MSWTETDDNKLQANLERLQNEQKNLQSQLNPIETIINNIRRIQSRVEKRMVQKVVEDVTVKEEETIIILPKDKWGEEITDEYRLKVKDECMVKTNELLGDIVE